LLDGESDTSGGWRKMILCDLSLGALGIVTRITLNVLPRP